MDISLGPQNLSKYFSSAPKNTDSHNKDPKMQQKLRETQSSPDIHKDKGAEEDMGE